MNRTLSFLFAAALGATLGALTALEYAPFLGASGAFATTLGVIVGGLVGYIAVDFRQFCVSVAMVGRATYVVPSDALHFYWESPRPVKIGAFYNSAACLLILMYTSGALIVAVSMVQGDYRLLLGLPPLVPFAVFLGHTKFRRNSTRTDYNYDFDKHFVYWLSPIGIIHFVILKAPLLVVRLFFNLVPWFVRSTGKFLKQLFITVHSERRLLCCLDATLGTIIGYHLGSWLAGTVSGLVFALISYELISKRLLRLQPA